MTFRHQELTVFLFAYSGYDPSGIQKEGEKEVYSQGQCSSPRVSTKVMFTMDSRAWKTILSKCRIDYNFGKGIKDTVVVNQKVKFMDQKTKKTMKVNM